MRQRRRAERSHFATPTSSRPGVSRRAIERIQQRLLLGGVAAVVVILLAILVGGWYLTSFQPPRRVVAEVDSRPVRLADIVSYTRLEGSVTGLLQPRNALNNYLRDAVLRLRAGTLGVSVSPAQVEENAAARFEPLPSNPEAPPSTSLGAEGRRNLEDFLEIFDVSEEDYRAWVEGQLAQGAIFDHFEAAQPELAEQVLVRWIVAENSVLAQAAFDRIEAGEDFAAVAVELSVDSRFANEDGEVGWVPQGAFPQIDGLLFSEDLELARAIGPLPTSLGSMVLQVSEGPSQQPLTDTMRTLLTQQVFQTWLDQQSHELVGEYALLTLDDINWVLGKVGAQ